MNDQTSGRLARRKASRALLAVFPVAAALAAGIMWPSSSEALLFGDCYGSGVGTIDCNCDFGDSSDPCRIRTERSGAQNCGWVSTPQCMDHDACAYSVPCGGY